MGKFSLKFILSTIRDIYVLIVRVLFFRCIPPYVGNPTKPGGSCRLGKTLPDFDLVCLFSFFEPKDLNDIQKISNLFKAA